jgi:hypothetical protein
MISTEMVSTTLTDTNNSESTASNKMDVDTNCTAAKQEEMDHEDVNQDEELNKKVKKEVILNGNHLNGHNNHEENDIEIFPKDNDEPNGHDNTNNNLEHDYDEETKQELKKLFSQDKLRNTTKILSNKERKFKMLKQLQLDLCSQEAKLMFLKKLYYSQHIPPSQSLQQRNLIQNGQMNKQQVLLQQQQRNQLNLNNGNNMNQQRSIINKKVTILSYLIYFLFINLIN